MSDRQDPNSQDPQNDYFMEPDELANPIPDYQPTDEEIRIDVLLRFRQHAEIDDSQIEVSVKDGEVTLRGTVADKDASDLVQANAERIFGVIAVHNELNLEHYDEEEEIRKRVARRMADRDPGGPTPTGPAGYTNPNPKD